MSEHFLVTGASGCIGAWTVRLLLDDGVPVTVSDVNSDLRRLRLISGGREPEADFAVLAKDNSESPTAVNGGLMDYEAQRLPQVLEQAITPLKVGSISRVVRSNYGFHIFKLERRAEPVPPDKARKEIEDKLLSEKNQKLIDDLNKRLLDRAKINIYRDRLGFNYAGSLEPLLPRK